MEDKDRLGQKLHDKGKGDEDRYFARQERERLEKLRKAAVPPPVLGSCPRDGSLLEVRNVLRVTVSSCPSCGGIWLDRGELDAIVEHGNEPGVTRWVRTLLGI